VVGGDGVRHVLQQHRLAGARRRHDEATLTPADRAQEVDDAGRQVARIVLEHEALVREERRQLVE